MSPLFTLRSQEPQLSNLYIRSTYKPTIILNNNKVNSLNQEFSSWVPCTTGALQSPPDASEERERERRVAH